MELYYLLGEINGKLDGLIDQQTKTIYALVALAGATVGLKLMGTPPTQVVMFYVKVFVFLFTILTAWSKRRTLKGWVYLFAFGFLAGVAQVLNIVVRGETTVATAMFMFSNVSLLAFLWNWDGWDKAKGDEVRTWAKPKETEE
jgi:hypothetical protein